MKIHKGIAATLITVILRMSVSGCAGVRHRHAQRIHKRPHHQHQTHNRRPRGRHHRHPSATVVVISKGHVHGHRCGHFRRGHTWYHLDGHVHEGECGHMFIDGEWFLKE